jgi:hypothetical protein
MSEQPEDASAQPDEGQQSDDSTSKQELDDGEPGDVGDSQLPADLQPTEDNPLARHPGQSGDEDDEIGADREGEPEKAPLTEEDSDYGDSGGGS